MRNSKSDARYSPVDGRSWIASISFAALKALQIVAFAVLAIAEPLVRLSIALALICAGAAGLFALTGPKNAPVTELFIGAGVLMLLPVLYYLLMQRLRPNSRTSDPQN